MRLQQAEHNERLSDHLLKLEEGSYHDWVVTTSFYACIHFVEHKIFPCSVDGIYFSTFGDYCYFKHRIQRTMASRHLLKAKLLDRIIPELSSRYRFLMDACMNSRYHNYRVSFVKAKSCNDRMKIIKYACRGTVYKSFE